MGRQDCIDQGWHYCPNCDCTYSAQDVEDAPRLRAELAAEREWLCEACNIVFPGPPTKGFDCVICPQCGGRTGQKHDVQIRRLKAELAAVKATERRKGAAWALRRIAIKYRDDYLPAERLDIGPICDDIEATADAIERGEVEVGE